jgi:hypothetical protein
MAGAAGMAGDDLLFVPEGLATTDRDGAGGLELIAYTLVQRATGAEFYAAVRNDAAMPVCEAGLMTDFIDQGGALVTSATSVLSSGDLYRFTDGSGVILPCITPGEIAMSVSTELPIVVAELGALEYRFPAFPLDGVVLIDGLTVSELSTISSGTQTAYTGALTNGLEGAVSNPKVTIFPLNRVGRPLGAATSSGTTDLPAGGSWAFETTAVDDVGVDSVAYPAASIQQ